MDAVSSKMDENEHLSSLKKSTSNAYGQASDYMSGLFGWGKKEEKDDSQNAAADGEEEKKDDDGDFGAERDVNMDGQEMKRTDDDFDDFSLRQ